MQMKSEVAYGRNALLPRDMDEIIRTYDNIYEIDGGEADNFMREVNYIYDQGNLAKKEGNQLEALTALRL
jgi:hypothetical protein